MTAAYVPQRGDRVSIRLLTGTVKCVEGNLVSVWMDGDDTGVPHGWILGEVQRLDEPRDLRNLRERLDR